MFKLVYIAPILLSGCFTQTTTLSETQIKTKMAEHIHPKKMPSNNNINSVISMSALQTVSYDDLTLWVIKLEDSRCATGTTCIWAGQMVVTIEVSNELQEKKQITLINKRKPKIESAFGFDFLLQGIEPHPKKGKKVQLSEKTVTLQIIRTIPNKK